MELKDFKRGDLCMLSESFAKGTRDANAILEVDNTHHGYVDCWIIQSESWSKDITWTFNPDWLVKIST